MIDYSLKNGEIVWFSFYADPTEDGQYIEAEIIDLNFALKAAAVNLKGYKRPFCVSLGSLTRTKKTI